MKHIFIVNPISGKRDSALYLVPELINFFSGKNIDYKIEITQRPNHASEIVESYAKSGEEFRFYSCGGDGTLNEVFFGAYKYQSAQVASVPCGSGNDFISNFGKPQDFLNIENQINGTAIEIDLLQVNEKIAASICSVGIDADIAKEIPKYRRLKMLGGKLAYTASIVENILKPTGKNLKILIDGKEYFGQYILAAFSNGGYYGGGFNAAPTADLTDGKMDIVLVDNIHLFKIADIINDYKKGIHIVNGEVVPKFSKIMKFIVASEAEFVVDKPTIINIDGEVSLQERIAIKILRKAARFSLPFGISYSKRKI